MSIEQVEQQDSQNNTEQTSKTELDFDAITNDEPKTEMPTVDGVAQRETRKTTKNHCASVETKGVH